MNIYTGNTYIIVFFIYELAFFSLGISALQQGIGRISTLPILDEVKYLGVFGIIHGITEWLVLVIISKMYGDFYNLLYITIVLLNSLSFLFLWLYGVHSMNYSGKHKKIFIAVPYLVFMIWACIFAYYIFIYIMHGEFRLSIPKVLGRYLLGFTSAIITALAFNRNARAMGSLKYKKIFKSFKILSLLFLAYGLLAGLIVKKEMFFPANIINNTAFKDIFYVPVELIRGIVAVLITVEFVKVMNIFRAEVNSKIDILKEHHIIAEERRRLGRELHDVIIQTLFASGLQVEAMLVDEEEEEKKRVLKDVKKGLNDAISLIREFIKKVSKQKFDFDDLRFKLNELVDRFMSHSSIKINIKYSLPDVNLGTLSPETLSQVYYTIQEAIINAVKHSGGDSVNVSLGSNLEFFTAIIEDNGKGFVYSEDHSYKGYGIRSMKERVALCRGKLVINSKEGTKITLNIPWEGQ